MNKDKYTQKTKIKLRDTWVDAIAKFTKLNPKMKIEEDAEDAKIGITDIWVDAVVKLMMLTHDQKLHWKRVDISDLSSCEIDAYIAEYNGKRLRLAETELKLQLENSGTPRMDYGYIDDRNAFILEFVDEHGRSLWKFPQTSALRGLMSAVRYQAADVKTFLHEILKDEEVS